MVDRLKAVLFDVDGTLVDSNDAHARAWVRAFEEHDVRVDPAFVRRCVGMGGDKLMPAVSGIEESSALGQRIGKRRGEIFTSEYLPELRPFDGSAALVAALKARGLRVVAASSARKDELRALLRAGVAPIAFRCGGWSDGELKGASAIYDGPWDLLRQLEASSAFAGS